MMLFFDLDGPILDVSDRYYKAYADSLGCFGYKALDKDDYWNLKRAKTPDYDILRLTSCERLLDKFIAKRKFLIEEKNMLKMDSVWADVRETYRRLFKVIPAVLVTLRTYKNRTIWQLKNLGIHSWFKTIISNPAPVSAQERWKMKVKFIKEKGVLKNQDCGNCIFIGDTETDILAGKNLGMKTIGVSFGIRDKKILSPLDPDLIFDKPLEFSKYLKNEYL